MATLAALNQHTLNHKRCPACRDASNLLAAEKKLRYMSLVSALEIWFESKLRKNFTPKHLECCRGYKKKLLEFFGDVKLSELSGGSFSSYQHWRSATAGPSAINHELNALVQIMRRADLWKALSDDYAPLKEKGWQSPRTFTQREQQLVFDYAAQDPNVELAGIVARITRNTTASGCELRGLRIRDIELEAQPPRIHIPPDATKNSVRPRTIPLNGEALDAFRAAISRANRLGSHMPDHYIFPFRINRRRWDPDRRASNSWLRKQFKKMRDGTGIKHLRPHAFRHLAVTEMLESGVPERTVIEVSGWVSRKMIDRYSHSRIESKMEAVESLSPHTKPPAKSNLIEFRARL